MAFSAAKCLSRLTTRLVSSHKLGTVGFRGSKELIFPNSLFKTHTNNNFTRSLWHMSCLDRKHVCDTHSLFNTKCSCCQIHTQGDKELVDFLQEEIKLEKSSRDGKVPQIKGFDAKIDGAEVTLTKKAENETIVVSFNINDSVDAVDDESLLQDTDKPAATEMVSKPAFVVEINKGGSASIALQCSFPPRDVDPVEEEEERFDEAIEIQEVAILEAGQDWVEKTYTINAATMDGNLYDLLMNMLEDRGIDANFADQMVEFCTALEHEKYVNLLEGLSTFANSS